MVSKWLSQIRNYVPRSMVIRYLRAVRNRKILSSPSTCPETFYDLSDAELVTFAIAYVLLNQYSFRLISLREFSNERGMNNSLNMMIWSCFTHRNKKVKKNLKIWRKCEKGNRITSAITSRSARATNLALVSRGPKCFAARWRICKLFLQRATHLASPQCEQLPPWSSWWVLYRT